MSSSVRSSQPIGLFWFLEPPDSGAEGYLARVHRPDRLSEDLKNSRLFPSALLLKPIKIVNIQGSSALRYPSEGRIPVSEVRGPLGTALFLKASVELTQGLVDIHLAGYLHRGLSPHCLFVDPKSGSARIACFEWVAPKEVAQSLPAGLVDELVPYISPELAGRLNRPVEEPSDLYALGLNLYLLLTGSPAYEEGDPSNPLRTLHQQLSISPIPCHLRNSEVPESLSEIVMKLIAKNPDDRYPSSKALLSDLKKAELLWNERGQVPRFPLATDDGHGKFVLSRRLVGREKELQRLHTIQDLFVSDGKTRILWITGASGSGKSALIHQFRKESRYLFLSGKFDQFQRERPLSSLANAFAEWVNRLLTLSQTEVDGWRSRIVEVLGKNARLLVDWFPSLDWLLAGLPDPPEVSLQESQARVQWTFGEFLRILTSSTEPLILFLDDVQWADSETVRLLKGALQNPRTRNILLIAAQRPGESELEVSFREGSLQERIHLEPLAESHIKEIVAETLHASTDEKDVVLLSHELTSRTQGNPFHLMQMLTSLYERGNLTFREGSDRLFWNSEASFAISDQNDVLALMVERASRLSESTVALLKKASCLGEQADAILLAAIASRTPEELENELEPAVTAGLLYRQPKGFRFAHDRIQYAMNTLVPADQKEWIHAKAAATLLEVTPAEKFSETSYEVANHLRSGLSAFLKDQPVLSVIQVFLAAGKRARRSGAGEAAVSYLGGAQQLLGQLPLDQQGKLPYEIGFELAQALYLAGKQDQASTQLDRLLADFPDPETRRPVAILNLEVNVLRYDLQRALSAFVEILMLCGLSWPDQEELARVEGRLRAFSDRLDDSFFKHLETLPTSQDQAYLKRMDALAGALPVAFYLDGRLMTYIALAMSDLTLERGLSESSMTALAALAIPIGPVCGRYREGERLGALAFELAERQGSNATVALVSNLWGALNSFWIQPLPRQLQIARHGFSSAQSSGLLSVASYQKLLEATLLYLLGHGLKTVETSIRSCLEFMNETGFTAYTPWVLSIIHLAETLQGKIAREYEVPEYNGIHVSIDQSIRYAWTAIERFYVNDQKGARRALVWAGAGRDKWRPYVMDGEISFAAGLIGAVEDCLDEVLTAEAQLETWSRNNPGSFEARYLLIRAERERIEGKLDQAVQTFERSIFRAQEYGQTSIEALASERVGRFLRARKMEIASRPYLEMALRAYSRWEAQAKVDEIIGSFPELRFSRETWNFDASSLVEAARSVSEKIVLKELVETLMTTALEQSGADRGLLILVDREDKSKRTEWTIEAEQARSGHARGNHLLPESLIRYALRTGEKLILNHPSTSRLFGSDPYFSAETPKCVLVLPVRNRGNLIAIIYLENHLTPFAFSNERVTFLELLGAQAAVSIQNAALYRQSQEAVKDREEFISIASHELRTPLTSLKLDMDLILRSIRPGDSHPLSDEAFLKIADRSGHQLTRISSLVEQLLDFSKISAGYLKLEKREVDLRSMISRAIENFQPSSGVRSTITLEPGDPLHCDCDPSKFDQMILNLISNAVKYGDGKPVSIRIRQDREFATIEVSDQGIGIAPEHQKRIFGRFERAISSNEVSGLGLGLYIVSQLVRAHGGTISVQSDLGKGATFRIILPRGARAPK